MCKTCVYICPNINNEKSHVEDKKHGDSTKMFEMMSISFEKLRQTYSGLKNISLSELSKMKKNVYTLQTLTTITSRRSKQKVQ
jgi:hypothetical protein